jgi:hypothetical protein
MKKQLMIIGIIVLLVAVGLSGCSTTKSDKEKILGTWRNLDGSLEKLMTFYDNETVKAVTQSPSGLDAYGNSTDWYNFSIDDTKLCMTGLGTGKVYTGCVDYEFSNNDKTLTLTENGNSVVYTKQ